MTRLTRTLRRHALAGAIAACVTCTFAFTASPAAPPPESLLDGTRARAMLGTLRARAGQRAPKAPESAATLVVESCDDEGVGTLRQALALAHSGDTIDLRALACSTLSLDHGALEIAADDIAIVGPGRSRLRIEATSYDRVLTHAGVGTLHIEGVTIAGGRLFATEAYGGCVYAKGDVELVDVTIASCLAFGAVRAIGGGLVAFGGVTMVDSTIVDNTARANAAIGDQVGSGAGGVIAVHGLAMVRSRISGNTAESNAGVIYAGGAISDSIGAKYSTIADNRTLAAGGGNDLGAGGGLIGTDTITVVASTIARNHADVGGAIAITGGSQSLTIRASTLSGNEGRVGDGAIYALAPTSIHASTVVANRGGPAGTGGIRLIGVPLELTSSVVATNIPHDIETDTAVTGDHDLVMTAPGVALPSGTLTAGPGLSTLGDHGGPTETHLPLAGSPLLDAGANPDGARFDQRGSGHVRDAGMASDIGSTEFDADLLFVSGFERAG